MKFTILLAGFLFLFIQMVIPNGEKLLIEAKGAQKPPFINKAKFQQKKPAKSPVTYEKLLNGIHLLFILETEPEELLWSSPASFPSSVSKSVF